MKLPLYEKQFSGLGESRTLIFFNSKHLSFDSQTDLISKLIDHKFSYAIYSKNFFDNRISINDNLQFHAIKNNLPSDFFFQDSSIKQDERFLKPGSMSIENLWNLCSATCFLMLYKNLVLNKFFPLETLIEESKEFKKDTNLISIQTRFNELRDSSNYLMYISQKGRISSHFDKYILFNIDEYYGCYNSEKDFRKALKNLC
tara:strand:+ start:52 stop:654 length:603 start_codon:yes stop_codon:yes gene_type:complete